MFKPSADVTRCPICKEPLQIEEMDNFGLPVGYSAECPCCCGYVDIWINGLREVQCGSWNSEAYESDYGVLTEKEKKIERKMLWKLNWHLLVEKVLYRLVNLPVYLKSLGGSKVCQH